MRPVPPTLKDTTRYVLVRSEGTAGPQAADVILSRHRELFGTVGAAEHRPITVETGDDYAIIRVNVSGVDAIRCAVASDLGFQAIVSGVSGTLKRLRTKFLKER